MSNLLDREAEQGVCGAFLLDITPAEAAQVRTLLQPSMFGFPEYRHAYTTILSLLDRSAGVDPLTVRDEALRLRLPVATDLVAQLADATPTARNVVFHAKIVRDLWLRRELARHGALCQARAEAREVPIEDAFGETVGGLVASIAPTLSGAVRPVGQTVGGVLEILERRQDGELDPGAVPSGLDELDDLLGGFAPGRLIVAAARPKKGKTSFALRAARVAAQYGPVHYASLEMGEGELTERLLLTEAGVTQRKRLRFSDRELTDLLRASKQLVDLPLHIDTTSRTPQAIRLAIQSAMAHGHPPKLVVVDYLQLLRWPGKSENKNTEIGNITRFFKVDVAKALHVPVLLLSQLSRASVEGGKEREPGLSDLRDSGNIEQDADQIVMLHYLGAEDGRSAVGGWESPNLTKLLVRGNRHGAAGRVDAFYHRPTGEWRGWNRFDQEPIRVEA